MKGSPSQRDHGRASPNGEEPPWKSRLHDAIPLLVIGLVSFGLAAEAFQSRAGIGTGRLPLWAFFTAVGAVVSSGGIAVALAGGEIRDEPFEPGDSIILTRPEYDSLLREAGRSAGVVPARSTVPPGPPDTSRIGVAPSDSIRATSPQGASLLPVRDRTSPLPRSDVTPPTPDRSFEPPNPTQSAAGRPDDLGQALREMTDELRSLATDESRPKAAAKPTANVPRIAGPPMKARESSGDQSVRRNASASAEQARMPGRAGPSPTAVGRRALPTRIKRRMPEWLEVVPETTAPDVCSVCGTRIARIRTRCSSCQEPLCLLCHTRSDFEGHPDLCPRCDGLLKLSEEDPEGES